MPALPSNFTASGMPLGATGLPLGATGLPLGATGLPLGAAGRGDPTQAVAGNMSAGPADKPASRRSGWTAPSDKSQFDRLMVECLPAALAMAVKLTGSAARAEDLVQTALVKAARAAHTFRGEASFKTWLTRILINTFRDSVEKKFAAVEVTEELADRRTLSPHGAAVESETGKAVAQAVSGLPPRQREVLVLHAYEGLSTQEIGKVLETSEANVRKNLQLARERLKVVLRKHLSE